MRKIAEMLSSKGHNVHIVTRKVPKVHAYEKMHGFHVHRFLVFRKMGKLPLTPTKIELYQCGANVLPLLYKVIKKYKINILHTNFIVPSGLASAVLKDLVKIPFLLTTHAGDILDVPQTLNPIRTWILKRSDFVTACGKDMRNEIVRLCPEVEDKIAVIPNGVDIEEIDQANKKLGIREKFGIKRNDVMISCIGRLIWRKGVQYLIKSVPEVLSYNNNVKFVIVGTGPELGYLKSLVGSLKLDAYVVFTGFVSRSILLAIMHETDFFVQPTLWEGMPLAFLEEMACSKPIVSTRSFGVRELISNELGVLVPTADEKALAEGIITLIDDEDERMKLGQRARIEVETKYDWNVILDRYLEIYSKLTQP